MSKDKLPDEVHVYTKMSNRTRCSESNDKCNCLIRNNPGERHEPYIKKSESVSKKELRELIKTCQETMAQTGYVDAVGGPKWFLNKVIELVEKEGEK